jgi:hypothetical protein
MFFIASASKVVLLVYAVLELESKMTLWSCLVCMLELEDKRLSLLLLTTLPSLGGLGTFPPLATKALAPLLPMALGKWQWMLNLLLVCLKIS